MDKSRDLEEALDRHAYLSGGGRGDSGEGSMICVIDYDAGEESYYWLGDERDKI